MKRQALPPLASLLSVLVAGCAQPVAQRADSHEYLAAVVDALAPSAPHPRWAGVNTAAFDDAVFADDHHLIVSLDDYRVSGPEGTSIGHDVIASIDTDTGKLLWHHKGGVLGQTKLFRGPSGVGLLSRIVKEGKPTHRGVFLLDAAAPPAKALRYTLDAGVLSPAPAFTPDGSVMVVAYAGNLKWGVSAIDVAGDKKLWENLGPAGLFGRPLFRPGNDVTAVWATGLSGFDTHNGQRAWQAAGVEDAKSGDRIAGVGNDVLAASVDGPVWCVDGRSGAVKWQATAVPHPGTIVVDGDAVVVSGEDGKTMAGLSAKTGKPLFHVDLPAGGSGNVAISAGVVAVVLVDRVTFYDAKDGRLLDSSPLGVGFPARRLRDQVRVVGQNVVVASETAVRAFDLTTRKPSWEYVVKGAPPTVWGDRLPKAARQMAALGVKVTNLSSALAALPPTHEDTEVVHFDPIVGNAPDGSFDLGSSRLSEGANRAAAAADLSMAVVETTELLIAEADALHAAEVNGLFDNAKSKLVYAMRSFSHAVQGRYYVRPIGWLWGAGYFVVDLTSGRWTEVLAGPRLHFQDDLFVDYPIGMVSPTGDYLVGSAVLFDRSTWQEHPDLGGFQDEYRRMVRFDLPPSAFAPAGDYPAKSIVDDRLRTPR